MSEEKTGIIARIKQAGIKIVPLHINAHSISILMLGNSYRYRPLFQFDWHWANPTFDIFFWRSNRYCSKPGLMFFDIQYEWEFERKRHFRLITFPSAVDRFFKRCYERLFHQKDQEPKGPSQTINLMPRNHRRR